MRARALSIATAVAIASALGGAAVARASSGPNDGPAPLARESAGGNANARDARVAAFVQPGGFVARSKNVAQVTHPVAGLYCVDPSISIDVQRVMPSITVDWSSSTGDALLAQYRSSGIGCPVSTIAILTFAGDDGSFDPSNDVGFVLVVP